MTAPNQPKTDDVERSRSYLRGFDDHANLIDAREPFYCGYQAGWNARRWRYAPPWWARRAVVTTLDRAAARLARTRESWDTVTLGPPDPQNRRDALPVTGPP